MSSPFIGEFIGTLVLILLGDGVVANVVLKKSKGEGSGWIVIATGWAFAVVLGAFAAIATGSVQADLNPAVTLAKTLNNVYTFPVAFSLMAAQMAGAFVGACLVYFAYLPHWELTEDQGTKLAVFSTGPAVRNTTANLITEIIGTTMLMFAFFAIFSKTVGAIAPGFGTFLAGVVVWSMGLSLGGPTGYAINPARDLGPRIAHAVLPIHGKGSSDWSYAWVPVVGPMLGGVIAYLLARLVGLAG
ncbi:MIP/aquaporin family protein [Acetonema longum]|uniref:Major intrinsic protein n=1 Tax=Acetonema longum DSM 6540 TaxID=1009370 RepID=F7NP59_9FIRM|nr:MIP/aquaporin family protein [Acetonema longum]EGO62182.1 major intrinsic protein [Acetonema longum DSM 6540]